MPVHNNAGHVGIIDSLNSGYLYKGLELCTKLISNCIGYKAVVSAIVSGRAVSSQPVQWRQCGGQSVQDGAAAALPPLIIPVQLAQGVEINRLDQVGVPRQLDQLDQLHTRQTRQDRTKLKMCHSTTFFGNINQMKLRSEFQMSQLFNLTFLCLIVYIIEKMT